MSMQNKPVWEARFEELRAKGFTYEQALEVYGLLNKVRAFGSQTIATSAMASLLRAYEPGAVAREFAEKTEVQS